MVFLAHAKKIVLNFQCILNWKKTLNVAFWLIAVKLVSKGLQFLIQQSKNRYRYIPTLSINYCPNIDSTIAKVMAKSLFEPCITGLTPILEHKHVLACR